MLERYGFPVEFAQDEVLVSSARNSTAVEQLIVGSQPHNDFMRVHFMTPQVLMNFDWQAEDAMEKIQRVIEGRRKQGAIASNAAAIDLLGPDFIEGAVLYSLPEIDPFRLETTSLPRLCGLYLPTENDKGVITIDEEEMSRMGISDIDARRYMMERLFTWTNTQIPNFPN